MFPILIIIKALVKKSIDFARNLRKRVFSLRIRIFFVFARMSLFSTKKEFFRFYEEIPLQPRFLFILF